MSSAAAGGPRILIVDIETRPPLSFHWGMFDQNIGLNQVVDLGGVMAFAAKWHGSKPVEFRSDYHDGHDVMVARAYELVDEADAIVHYNGVRFDMKHLRREFLVAGMSPPSPHKDVDLMLAARRQFVTSTGSGKLDAWLGEFDLPRKLDTGGFELWRDCILGDDAAKAKAWRLMRRYNIQDVRSTEALYDRIRPWIAHHPHHALYHGDGVDRCQNCGSTDMVRRGIAYTELGAFQQFRCKAENCGRYSRSKHRLDAVGARAAA